MKNTIIKNTVKIISIAIIMALYSCDSDTLIASETSEQPFESKSVVTIKDHNSDELPGASSTLYRNKNKIMVNFNTTNLIPNNAYTLWWVVYEETLGSPNITYAAGQISGRIGTEIFSAQKSVDMNFKNPLTAEVHLVLHSHGRAVPGMLFDETQNFSESCLENSPPGSGIFHEDSDKLGRCADIQVAIHAPVIENH